MKVIEEKKGLDILVNHRIAMSHQCVKAIKKNATLDSIRQGISKRDREVSMPVYNALVKLTWNIVYISEVQEI